MAQICSSGSAGAGKHERQTIGTSVGMTARARNRIKECTPTNVSEKARVRKNLRHKLKMPR